MDKPFGTISIKPIGGLCNRLRAIDSALALAAKNGHRVVVYWERDLGLKARWEDLFEPTDAFDLIDITESWSERSRHKTINAGSRLLPIFHILKSFKYDKVVWLGDFSPLLKSGFDFSAWSGFRSIYIQSLSRFAFPERPFTFAIPVLELASQIDFVASSFNASTVGFHIRGTDHEKSLTHSPPVLFIQKAQQLLRETPSSRIFLACDEKEVKDRFKREFGDAIITLDILLERESIVGMKEAVKDLFLLSRCSRVYGSQFSSFSTTAAEIGGIPCEKLIKNE